MHIALLTGEYPPQPGGVGDYTHCLAQALADRKHRVSVMTGHEHGGLRVLEFGTSTPERRFHSPRSTIHPPQSPWGWRCWRDTIAALDELRPAVLHIQYQTGAYGMHPAINFLPWRLRALPGRPRIAVTFHDLLEPYLFPKADPLRRWVTLRLARDADAVITTNEEDTNRLHIAHCTLHITPCRAHAPISQPPNLSNLPISQSPNLSNLPISQSLITIPIGSNIPVAPPPGFARAAWREQLGVGRDELLIAYFGLLAHTKGVDLLLDAVHALEIPCRLLIIGGAATAPQDRTYAAAVSAQIERLGLRERVQITGQVDAARVSAHLLAADCVALPFRDGASFRRGSLLAALLHGCAIVTTAPPQPSAAARSQIIDGENVLLVTPDDSAALTAALRRLSADPTLRRRLSAGAQTLGAQFTWDDIADRHEQCYRACLPDAA